MISRGRSRLPIRACGTCAVFLCFLQAAPSLSDETVPRPPAIVPDGNGVVFSIGNLDGSNLEFEENGWEGISEFECTVGIDCSAGTFPMRFHAPSAYYWDYKAVQRAIIRFALAENLSAASLTLARAGDETSLIELDDGSQFTVTAEMLGSSGGGRYGQVILDLGPLEAGLHSLSLSVADDGEGNRRHALDAIVLTGSIEADKAGIIRD